MSELFRYAAFISYSSKDARFAQRLHRALEGYAIPAALGKFDIIGGGKINRIYPVFRDREELPAGDLGESIQAALKASAALVVVCSPAAAASVWVQKEIAFFLGLGRRNRVFAVIADDAPLHDEHGADATSSCFPTGLQDTASGVAFEPIAGDARKGKDDFRGAWLKIVAGLIGVAPGQLVDRDRRRQRSRRVAVGAGLAALSLTAGVSTAWVDAQTWRTRMSTYAEAVANQRRPLDALPFAAAGIAAPGSLIAARSDRAKAVLARVSGPVSRDLGKMKSYLLSEDGQVLVVQAQSGGGFFFNLARSARPRDLDLHPGDELVALSANGATLIVKSFGGGAVYYNLARGGTKRELGGWLAHGVLSKNGAALATYHPEGRTTYYDLARGARARELGDVGRLGLTTLTRSSIGDFAGAGGMALSANGAILVIQGYSRRPDDAGSAPYVTTEQLLAETRSAPTAYFDLARGSAKRDLGRLRRYELTDDGAYLMAHSVDGAGVLYMLNRGGEARDLGQLRAFEFALNGSVLVTHNQDGTASYYDLRRGGARRDLGKAPDFSLSDYGEALIVVADDGALTYYDFAHDRRRSLGRINTFNGRILLSSNGATLLTREPLKGAAYFDLTREGPSRDLGQLGVILSTSDLVLSANGAAAIVRDNGRDLVFYDLARGGARRVLGNAADLRYDGLNLSDNGAVLVARANDRSAVYYDLTHGDAGRDLGLLENFVLAKDGSALIVQSVDGSGALYSLGNHGAAGATTNFQTSRSGACAASGAAMRPFLRDLRATDQNGPALNDVDQRLFRDLRGRPWNPCDWRGLAAIFPDARSGDGWFEGARQWLRLASVRYFGAADWTCEETTSGASAETRERRKEMCQRTSQGTGGEE